MRRLTDNELIQEFERLDDCQGIDCRSSLMDQIRCGKVRMRSRWLVLTEYLGWRTTWLVLVLTLVAVINLSLYMVSKSPAWNFVDFGASGWKVILLHLPYGWWALALALMVATIIATRRFSISYIWPFQIFAVLTVLVIFFVGGFAFATGLNDYLYRKLVEEPGVGNSLLAKIYCLSANRGMHNPNAVLGEVLDIPTPTSFVVQTPDLDVLTVVTQSGTQWPGRDEIQRFQVVKMMGQREQDVFWATHVKLMPNEPHLRLTRDEMDCVNQQEWLRKQRVVEKRRQLVETPFSPASSMVQLIRSVQ